MEYSYRLLTMHRIQVFYLRKSFNYYVGPECLAMLGISCYVILYSYMIHCIDLSLKSMNLLMIAKLSMYLLMIAKWSIYVPPGMVFNYCLHPQKEMILMLKTCGHECCLSLPFFHYIITYFYTQPHIAFSCSQECLSS